MQPVNCMKNPTLAAVLSVRLCPTPRPNGVLGRPGVGHGLCDRQRRFLARRAGCGGQPWG